jgi:hypothetical protein
MFDKNYRLRRGKLVEIPDEWVGNFTTKKTIRQRPSKLIGKVKRAMSPKAQYIDTKFTHIED